MAVDRPGAGCVRIGVVDFSKAPPVRKASGLEARRGARLGARDKAGGRLGQRAAAVGEASVGGAAREGTRMTGEQKRRAWVGDMIHDEDADRRGIVADVRGGAGAAAGVRAGPVDLAAAGPAAW